LALYVLEGLLLPTIILSLYMYFEGYFLPTMV